jgi:RecA-family ATPase
MAYLPGDAYKDQDVRKALTPLAKVAQRTGCAMLLLRHLRKGKGGEPVYLGGGSIGIVGR